MWVKKNEIPEIAEFMSDFWKLMKQYWIVENTNQYWQAFISESSALSQKYNNRLVQKLLAVFVNYQEEVCQE